MSCARILDKYSSATFWPLQTICTNIFFFCSTTNRYCSGRFGVRETEKLQIKNQPNVYSCRGQRVCSSRRRYDIIRVRPATERYDLCDLPALNTESHRYLTVHRPSRFLEKKCIFLANKKNTPFYAKNKKRTTCLTQNYRVFRVE